MTEYKLNNCTVKIHGSPDLENLKAKTTDYLKKVERVKKSQKKKGA